MRYVLLGLLLVVCCGCPEPDRDQMFSKPEVKATSQSTETGFGDEFTLPGQQIAFVKFEFFGKWLQDHKNVEIVSIAAVDRGGHGYTSSFIIVYKPMPN